MFRSGSGSVRVKFKFRSFSCTPYSSRTQFGLGGVRVPVTYKYHVQLDLGSVRVEFGLGLFRVAYGSPVRIRYG